MFLSESLDNPQITPADHAYTILQDHGLDNGGWGPAAIIIPGLMTDPHSFIYTGSDEGVLKYFAEVAKFLHQTTGKATKFVRYNQMEILEELP